MSYPKVYLTYEQKTFRFCLSFNFFAISIVTSSNDQTMELIIGITFKITDVNIRCLETNKECVLYLMTASK